MKIAIVIPNYNGASLVIRCVEAMHRQKVPEHSTLTVIVVDDGSTDGSAEILLRRFGESIRLIRMPENQGRCTARNAGASATNADLLIFVDSDCVPPDSNLVCAHAAEIERGVDVSFGQICTPGDRFWDRLQRDANATRAQQFERGDQWVFTTQNVAITRTVFDRAGGFDPIFDRFGFEDRDLFIRMLGAGARATYTPNALVVHEDRVTLSNVARKQGEAGYFAAHLFRQRHPQVYSRMGYSRLDCALHPRLRILDMVLSPLVLRAAKRSGRWLEWRWMPFRLRSLLARALYGMCYLHGTARRLRQQPA